MNGVLDPECLLLRCLAADSDNPSPAGYKTTDPSRSTGWARIARGRQPIGNHATGSGSTIDDTDGA